MTLELSEHLDNRGDAVLVPILDRFGDDIVGHFASPDLDHIDGPRCSGNHHVHVGVFELRNGRVDDELFVDARDARRADRPIERHRRDGKSRGGRDHAENVGLVLQIGRDDHDLDLNFVLEAVGEERPHRTVDHPHGEDFLVGRTSFALEESAGELAGG